MLKGYVLLDVIVSMFENDWEKEKRKENLACLLLFTLNLGFFLSDASLPWPLVEQKVISYKAKKEKRKKEKKTNECSFCFWISWTMCAKDPAAEFTAAAGPRSLERYCEKRLPVSGLAQISLLGG